ncbi:hypothetical protein BK645_13720 [Pseudomonas protegens]|nr:hypothetical protein BK645_13720 [Pseudomonas protegens]ROM37608.1 hypothetical protein BK646_21765 [Pseudomonas protegens]
MLQSSAWQGRQGSSIASLAELGEYDAVIFGTPTGVDPLDVASTCMRWSKLSEEAPTPHN